MTRSTDAAVAGRRRLGLRRTLMLAAMPTATILLVMAFVEVLTQQRLLFAMAVATTATLLVLQRAAVHLMRRHRAAKEAAD